MKAARPRILLVDDDEGVRFGVRDFLELNGFAVDEAEDCRAAERVSRAAASDIAIIDFVLPDGDALALMPVLKAIDPAVALVVLTGHASIDLAVRAVQVGAEQFLTKPVDLHALKVIVDRLLEQQRNRKARQAACSNTARHSLDPFIGSSAAMRRLAEQARRVLASASPILIQGETGSGKGVLARWLHSSGPRADEAFVDLNCAGLSREFLETELFGHAKGAFTGAASLKPGLLKVAHRGTVFLDEIGDMPQEVQPRLLKVIEDKRFRRLGEVSERSVDVRLVAASFHNLAALVRENRFRSDLYFRLNTLPLVIPPLRERREDIVALAEHLLDRLAPQVGRSSVALADDARHALLQYHWPGNVRELQNSLERAMLLSDKAVLGRRELRLDETDPAAPTSAASAPGRAADEDITLVEVERRHILRVLEREGGRVDAAAAKLGVPRSTLYQKLKLYRGAARVELN